MKSTFERELSVAVGAVSEAAKLCSAVQSAITPDVLSKKDKSPVTVADFGSQALVCRALHRAFPHDPIVAEEDSAELMSPEQAALLVRVTGYVRHHVPEAEAAEVCRWIDLGGGGQYSRRFWTLDPIDGTKGFLRREQYAVALCLIVEGEPTVAALACPNLEGGTIFTAVRGKGTTVRALTSGTAKPVAVSKTSDPSAARFCESVESGHSSHDHAAQVARDLSISAEPIRMDSQCKYGVVAGGQADIYMRLPTRADYVERIWDHATGALVVTEAGGKVTDIRGQALDFRHGRGLEKNSGVLATNGLLHERLLESLAAVGVR